MIATCLRRLCFLLMLLAVPVGNLVRAEEPQHAIDSRDDALGINGFDIPPGDPWYEPLQQRRRRPSEGDRLVFKARIVPHWFDGDDRFWYRNDLAGGTREFVLVDARSGTRSPAFDHDRLAASLSKATGKTYEADRLPFDEIKFKDRNTIRVHIDDNDWICNLGTYACEKATSKEKPEPAPRAEDRNKPRRRGRRGDHGPDFPGEVTKLRSPDGHWTAFIKEHNVVVIPEGKILTVDNPVEILVTDDGKPDLSYGRLSWSPDSKALVAFRIEPGDRKEVYLIQSSPPDGGRAKLRTRPYPLPGDKFNAYELYLINVESHKGIRPEVDRIDYGHPTLHWDRDGRHFSYEKIDRGHQRYRLIRVDSHNGEARTLIDEKTETFIWTAHREAIGLDTITWLDDSNELIYASERDGWRHLYRIDARTGAVKNAITRGAYVVRGIDRIDEANKEVWFHASGKERDEDPYFVHYYRVKLDGTGLVRLTKGNGSHSIQYSPGRRFLIDTYSRVGKPPVHELRRVSDGGLVCHLETADIKALEAIGWRAPEVFTAKGRDGKTDIWGIICRPKDFDPTRKYPVIESIYAGPQGSFVPKTFSASRRFSTLTDLGFIVVQIDGMGTANRSKAFHDVCWHNLKDAGFPDRILWHQAVARKYGSSGRSVRGT